MQTVDPAIEVPSISRVGKNIFGTCSLKVPEANGRNVSFTDSH